MTANNIIVKEGDYELMGASVKASSITFTFECEKEHNCAVRLYDNKSGEFTDYAVSCDYCMGAVRSLTIEGIDPTNYTYNYLIEGREVIDPFAKNISGREKWGVLHTSVRSAFSTSSFDWEEDNFPEIPREDMILYKLHVRGFSMDKSSGVKAKGTFEGVIEKIDYLKSLGVTTVELMPIYEFEETLGSVVKELDTSEWNPQAMEGYKLLTEKATTVDSRINYWGYGAGNYYAVKKSYAKGDAAVEFKNLVKQLHKNGIECIMEVSFGEFLNPNYVGHMLRYWVKNFHVDGFHILSNSFPIETITEDIFLKRTKIFYHSYPEYIWNQDNAYKRLFVYNDDYLYVMRKQVNHIDANTCDFLGCFNRRQETIGYVNYIANNNGFTLADIFSYAMKHNEENGENNTDGNDWNYSVNLGVEGESRKKNILKARADRMKLAMGTVLLARGVPLIYAGDEFGNSQMGNNNAYCQDNKIGWVNWKTASRYPDYVESFKALVDIRKKYSHISADVSLKNEDYKSLGLPDVSYHDIHAWTMNIYPSLMMVGLLFNGRYMGSDEDIMVAFNFSGAATSIALTEREDYGNWQTIYGENRIESDRIIVEGESIAVVKRKALTPEEIAAKKTLMLEQSKKASRSKKK